MPGPSTKKLKLDSFHLPKDKFSKSLSKPFNFPQNFPPEVEGALSTKSMLPRTLNRFLTTIARAIYNEKCYPTAEEYRRVAEETIQRYPFLASPVGSPYVSVNDLPRFEYTNYFTNGLLIPTVIGPY